MDKEKETVSVPYFVYEGEQVRSERIIKRLIIALILTMIMLFASNALWLYEWCQYDYQVSETIDLDTGDGGDANYIGNDGEINNGTH